MCTGTLVALAGCSAASRAPERPPLHTFTQRQWEPIETSHVRVRVELPGSVPNSALQLPRVSPDGKWIAYLRVDSPEPVTLNALIDGQGLRDVSLVVRDIARSAKDRIVCSSGAAWAVWSGDSRKVFYVSYHPTGKCTLGIYNIITDRTYQMDVGLKHMIAPAVSPDGQSIAVVAFDKTPDDSNLFVIDLATEGVQEKPHRKPPQRILSPQWIDDRTLVYLETREKQTFLHKWVIDQDRIMRLYPIYAPARITHALQVFAGIPRPVSSDGQTLAYYSTRSDRIVLLELSTGKQQPLAPRTRTGCWMGNRVFTAATDKKLMLRPVGAAGQKNLLSGRWLPLWADATTNRIILCTQGADPWTFNLVRIHLLGE